VSLPITVLLWLVALFMAFFMVRFVITWLGDWVLEWHNRYEQRPLEKMRKEKRELYERYLEVIEERNSLRANFDAFRRKAQR